MRSVLGAFIGLMLVFTTDKFLGEHSGIDEWLMASLGTSALLAVPMSARTLYFGDVCIVLFTSTCSRCGAHCGFGTNR